MSNKQKRPDHLSAQKYKQVTEKKTILGYLEQHLQ